MVLVLAEASRPSDKVEAAVAPSLEEAKSRWFYGSSGGDQFCVQSLARVRVWWAQRGHRL